MVVARATGRPTLRENTQKHAPAPRHLPISQLSRPGGVRSSAAPSAAPYAPAKTAIPAPPAEAQQSTPPAELTWLGELTGGRLQVRTHSGINIMNQIE
jgi:hypothetical protein